MSGDVLKNHWNVDTTDVRKYWEDKFIAARKFMESRSSIASTLIEIASQHPLIDGLYPGEEFEKRLLLGIELYEKEKKEGRNVEIYVPGSIHVYNRTADKISLSEAGKRFLTEKGIPDEIIRGEDLNLKYKEEEGIYNSADECFAAASYFKDGNFGRLYSVHSPVQTFRKTIYYIEFGVFPLSYSVPVENTYHNFINEIFSAIPYVLFDDHSMQGKDSLLGNKAREERRPKNA